MTFLKTAAMLAFFALPAAAQTPQDFTDRITAWEGRLDARIGVAVQSSAGGWSFSHRGDERFLMNSTVKTPICGAVLASVDAGDLALDDMLPIADRDILDYAPVTAAHVGAGMSAGDLCFATLDQSDNTAANLLLDRIGGPEVVTAFLRGIGDDVTRADRMEPELNTFAAGDPRDTTTPLASARWMEVLLHGDALSPASRTQLADWMRPGGVTGALLRPAVPADWDVADKSGSGTNTRNLVAMVTPPTGGPVFVTIFISDTTADTAARNEALADIARGAMALADAP